MPIHLPELRQSLFGKSNPLNELPEYIQAEIVKVTAVKLLRDIADLLENDHFDDVLACTVESPAGDCMGCDNTYINFNTSPLITGYALDIEEVIDLIKKLRKWDKK